MKPRHRLAVLASASILSASIPPAAKAEQEACAGLDLGTIEWIVPYSAGGGYDTYSRLLEPYVERQSGADVVVINKPGAAAMIAVKYLLAAQADDPMVGIIPGNGLLIAGLMEPDVPHPSRDFRILGQISPSPHIWVVGADSPIEALGDLLAVPDDEPLLFSASGTNTLASVVFGSHVLGLEAELVAGYDGTRESSMAVLRGEVDATSVPLDSLRDLILSGEVRPVLQITSVPGTDDLSTGVPTLAEAAAEQARRHGQDPKEARSFASAVADMVSLTRVVVTPRHTGEAVALCMEHAFAAAARDPGFAADARAAGRSAEFVSRREVEAQIEAASAHLDSFSAILQPKLSQLRD